MWLQIKDWKEKHLLFNWGEQDWGSSVRQGRRDNGVGRGWQGKGCATCFFGSGGGGEWDAKPSDRSGTDFGLSFPPTPPRVCAV